jgi:hypothetical protein
MEPEVPDMTREVVVMFGAGGGLLVRVLEDGEEAGVAVAVCIAVSEAL